LVKKIIINLILSLLIVASVFCFSPSQTFAAPSTKLFENIIPTITGPRIGTSDTPKSIEEIALDIILNIILPLIGAVALIFVVYGGVMIMTSAGDPEKLTKAKKTLLWAIIGIIIVVLSYLIVVSLSTVIKGFI
jgi:type IV secretory pathway VirB2 component (pilin)